MLFRALLAAATLAAPALALAQQPQLTCREYCQIELSRCIQGRRTNLECSTLWRQCLVTYRCEGDYYPPVPPGPPAPPPWPFTSALKPKPTSSCAPGNSAL